MKKCKLLISALVLASTTFAALRNEISQMQYSDYVAFSNAVRIGYYNVTSPSFTNTAFPVKFSVTTTDGIMFPSGNTSERPTVITNYPILRYNTDIERVEYNFNSTNWQFISTTNDINEAIANATPGGYETVSNAAVTAYGWGNHSTNGYLTTESDPAWHAGTNAIYEAIANATNDIASAELSIENTQGDVDSLVGNISNSYVVVYGLDTTKTLNDTVTIYNSRPSWVNLTQYPAVDTNPVIVLFESNRWVLAEFQTETRYTNSGSSYLPPFTGWKDSMGQETNIRVEFFSGVDAVLAGNVQTLESTVNTNTGDISSLIGNITNSYVKVDGVKCIFIPHPMSPIRWFGGNTAIQIFNGVWGCSTNEGITIYTNSAISSIPPTAGWLDSTGGVVNITVEFFAGQLSDFIGTNQLTQTVTTNANEIVSNAGLTAVLNNKADQSNLTAIENRTNDWNTVTNKADQVNLTSVSNRVVSIENRTNTWNTVTNKADQVNLTSVSNRVVSIENRTNDWNTVTNKADQVNLTSVSNRVVSIEANTNTWNTVTNKVDVDGNNITNIPAWFVKLGLGTSATNPASSFVQSSEVGVANGVCELDANGFIPLERIPEINIVFSGRQIE